jgi:hypothetical protein
MVVKTLAGFKRLAIIAVAMLGFLAVVKWDVQAHAYRSGFKTSDQVQGQGADRSRKRSIHGYVSIYRRFATQPLGLRWGLETTSNPDRVFVAQSETQTATNEKNASSPASKEPESKADEKKESTSVKKKPLKDFQPSERIDAEQAVDFPYDI